MGNKSRLKKERKASDSVDQNVSVLNGALQKLSRDSKFDDGNGGFLMVLDGMGGVMGPDEAHRDYWAQVGEAIRGDDPAHLPAMAQIGRLMGFSIFDVQIPIFEIGHEDEEQAWEMILLALFIMDYVECFRWIYTKLIDNINEISGDANASLSCLHGRFFMEYASYGIGSPKERMTSLVMRDMIERDWHRNGSLMSGPSAYEAFPIFITELANFKAEITSAGERLELDLGVTAANSGHLVHGSPSTGGGGIPSERLGLRSVGGRRL